MVVLVRGAHSVITEGKIHSGWRDGAVAWRTCCSYRGLRFNLQNQMVATNPCNSSSRWWMPFLHHFVMPCSFPWSCFLHYFISMVWVFCIHVCLCTIHAQPQRPDWNSYSRYNLLGFENKTNLSKHWSKSMPSHLQILTVAEKLPWRRAGRVSSPQLVVLILWRPHRKPTCPALHTSCF